MSLCQRFYRLLMVGAVLWMVQASGAHAERAPGEAQREAERDARAPRRAGPMQIAHPDEAFEGEHGGHRGREASTPEGAGRS